MFLQSVRVFLSVFDKILNVLFKDDTISVGKDEICFVGSRKWKQVISACTSVSLNKSNTNKESFTSR